MDKSNNVTISEPMRRIVSRIGERALNKNWLRFSLVGAGLIGFVVFSRMFNQKSKTNLSKSQREPAHGRVWNINLDPHESGMSA